MSLRRAEEVKSRVLQPYLMVRRRMVVRRRIAVAEMTKLIGWTFCRPRLQLNLVNPSDIRVGCHLRHRRISCIPFTATDGTHQKCSSCKRCRLWLLSVVRRAEERPTHSLGEV